MVYFLCDEPANEIFLLSTSKDDIDKRAGEDQTSKMLQSALNLITKVWCAYHLTFISYVWEYVSLSNPEVGKHW